MTTVPKPTALTATYTATYDAWNRLVEVKSGANVVLKCEYDGLGRRTKKHINTGVDQVYDEFRHFFYNSGWQILETRLSESENTAPDGLQPEYQYVWSLRYIDAPVLRDENTDEDDLCDDETLYYLNDANMNVTCLTDTGGDAVERYVYDPYGKVTVYNSDWSATVAWAASKKNPIRYSGYYFDSETGLYTVRHRTLHVYLGWLSRDPTGYVDGMNLYQAVGSDPVSLVDPYGLWRTDIHQDATTEWAGEARGYDRERQCTTMFKDGQPAAIGAADEAIDYGETAPTEDTSWHFRSRRSQDHQDQATRDAIEDAENLRCDEAIRNLGESLHPLQDSFSHTELHGAWTPAAHVATAGRSLWPRWAPGWAPHPDDADEWEDDVALTRAATMRALKDFLDVPCNLCVKCVNTE